MVAAPALVFVGIKDTVLALDEGTGAEVWRQKLRGGAYVTVLHDGVVLLAAAGGEVWRLDPTNGAVLWHNELTGMLRGVASLATARASGGTTQTDLAEDKRAREEAAGE